MTYSVEAILALVDDVSPGLRTISAGFDRLVKIVKSTQLAIDELKLPKTLLEGIDAADAAFKALDDKIAGSEGFVKKLGETITGLGGVTEAAVTEMGVGLGAFNKDVDASMLKVKALAESTKLAGAGSATGAGGKVVVAQAENASLSQRQHAAHGLHFARSKEFGGGVAGSGDGLGYVFAGLAIGDLAKHAITAGMAFDHVAAQFKAQSFSQADIAAATKASWELAGANLNTTVTGNMQTLLEINKATGKLSESIELLPDFQRAANVIHSSSGGKASEEGQQLGLARAMEELGATQRGNTPEERAASIRSYLRDWEKTAVWSRGQVDGNFMFGLTNNSGGMSTGWDEKFATVAAPILGMETKAGKMGNADYMAIKSIAEGKISAADVESLVKAGLITDKSDYDVDKEGKYKLHKNSRFAEGIGSNFWDWTGRQLENLKAGGTDIASDDVMSKKINEMGGSKSYQQALRLTMMPEGRAGIQKDIDARNRIGADAADIQKREDPTMKLDALSKSWENLMTSLGSASGPAQAAIVGLTGAIGGLAQIGHDHPAGAGVALWDGVAAAGGLLAYGGNHMLGNPAGKLGMGGLLGGASVLELGGLGLAAQIASSHGVGGENYGGNPNDSIAKRFLEGLTRALDPGIGDRIFGGNGHRPLVWNDLNPIGTAHADERKSPYGSLPPPAMVPHARIPGSDAMLPAGRGFAGSAGTVSVKVSEAIKNTPVGVGQVTGDVNSKAIGVTQIKGEVSVTNLNVLIGALQAAVAAVGNRPIHLDGKAITASVVKRMTVASRFPTSMGAPDTHSHYVSPGTPIMDAA